EGQGLFANNFCATESPWCLTLYSQTPRVSYSPPDKPRGNAPAPPSNQLAQPEVAQRFLNVDVLRQLAVQLQLILDARVLQLRARVAEILVLPGPISQHETSHQTAHRLLRSELRQPRAHHQAAAVVLVEPSLGGLIHPAVHNLTLPVRG